MPEIQPDEPKPDPCPRCAGTGKTAARGQAKSICPDCKGEGSVQSPDTTN